MIIVRKRNPMLLVRIRMVHGPVNIKKLGNHEVKIMKHFRCTFTEKEKKKRKKT